MDTIQWGKKVDGKNAGNLLSSFKASLILKYVQSSFSFNFLNFRKKWEVKKILENDSFDGSEDSGTTDRLV